MTVISRRDFVASSVVGGLGLSSAVVPRVRRAGSSQLADSRIDVLLEESIGTIAPDCQTAGFAGNNCRWLLRCSKTRRA